VRSLCTFDFAMFFAGADCFFFFAETCSMRVLIAFNEPVLPITHPEARSERAVLDVVASIVSRLNGGGVEFSQFGVSGDLATFRDVLQSAQPDVVLNLFEGFGDDPNSEIRFARLLEDEGVAFTGASSEALWRTGRKDIAKKILAEAGLTTPAWHTIEQLPPVECHLEWPVIIKPAQCDASVGIQQASVVTHRAQLNERVHHTADQFGLPVLLEEFIRGREVSVALFDWPEITILPIVETQFASHSDIWPIDSYDAKWVAYPGDRQANTLHYPADLSNELACRVAAAAQTAYQALGCRGFVTIDFRIRDEVPYILEVNSNADLKPSVCLTELLELTGVDYNTFIWQIILSAVDQSATKSQASL
jgi:D-alanine-D-alanine ligase